MAQIFKDDTDQYLLFGATSSADYTAFVGANDGDALPNAVLLVVEYKQEGTVVETPSVTWNATVGMWKAVIPAENITQYGSGLAIISGDGMISVCIEFETVKSAGGGSGGMGHIITSYTFNPTLNTITITETEYSDIIQEQILSIFNSTTGQWYYNSELRRYGAEPGKPWTKYYPLESVSNGVITYTAPDNGATSTDILQIIVNNN